LALRHAADLDPVSEARYPPMANLLKMMGRQEEVKRCLDLYRRYSAATHERQSLRIRSTQFRQDVRVLRQLGLACERAGLLSEAERTLARVLAQKPGDAAVQRHLLEIRSRL